ncbi:hypothetical protein AB0C38_33825 [Amycolatopsis sp. NPDC048633]|uniref:hypothetical protein n=1 Tax=Amycolatopsis sp. NPDC048633 TaxID=3157095 RepID=UPI0033FD971C
MNDSFMSPDEMNDPFMTFGPGGQVAAGGSAREGRRKKVANDSFGTSGAANESFAALW